MAGAASAGTTAGAFHFEVVGYERRYVSRGVMMMESEEWFRRMEWWLKGGYIFL